MTSTGNSGTSEDEPSVVIVTGAARGMGLALAEYFAADGAKVVLADLNLEAAQDAAKRIRAGGGQAHACRVDVTDESSTLAMASETVETWGRIDILINNAGLWGDLRIEKATTTDIDYWDLAFAVHVRGTLLCSRAVLPSMRARGWGRIVNITSMGAYMLGAPAYCASKLAVSSLTWNLAAEVGGEGVTVNSVAPGTLDTEATRGHSTEESVRTRLAGSIIKRLGQPRDIYAALKYFTSAEAEWCTGQTLLVDGGVNARL